MSLGMTASSSLKGYLTETPKTVLDPIVVSSSSRNIRSSRTLTGTCFTRNRSLPRSNLSSTLTNLSPTLTRSSPTLHCSMRVLCLGMTRMPILILVLRARLESTRTSVREQVLMEVCRVVVLRSTRRRDLGCPGQMEVP